MLDPTPLLGLLRFAVVGHGRVAGRETITAEAVPRRRDPRHDPRSFELYELGAGADCYTLEIDAQRGVLLEVVASRDGEPFNEVTTVAIAFDRPISEERFTFEPPVGEEIQPTWGHPPERISVREAQRRAAFTVLIPDRIQLGGTGAARARRHIRDPHLPDTYARRARDDRRQPQTCSDYEQYLASEPVGEPACG
jgi:hypothetical protein